MTKCLGVEDREDDPRRRPRAVRSSLAVALVSAAALLMPRAAAAEVTHLSASLREAIMTQQFRVVAHVSQIPESVKKAAIAAMSPKVGDQPLAMADPGAPFQATDVIVDPKLPGRRLIAAFASPDYWIMSYEIGGIAHTFHVAAFRVDGERAKFLWQAWTQEQVKTIDGFRALIKNANAKTINDSYTSFY